MQDNIKRLIEHACSKSELFKDIELPIEEIQIISAVKNQHLNKISDNSIVLILSGEVDIYSMSYSGDEVYLSTLKTGDCTGISNIFTKNEISTIIKCSSDVDIACISEVILKKIMKVEFELTERLLMLYNSKIQFLIGRIESLTIHSATSKLANYLLSCNDDKDCLYVPSKQKLAEYLGISRASLYRELAILIKNGIIETDRKFLYIKNEEELRKLL